MNDIVLSPRLAIIAGLAASGRRIADVGTDHGGVPVWLALHTNAERIVASDIKPGPLESARRTADSYGVASRIEFYLCDGLDFRGAGEMDTVVIAGMGGESIAGILSRARWTATDVSLVLCPHGRCDELCRYLKQTGCAIRSAALVRDAGRLYPVLCAAGGENDDGIIYAEDALLRARDPLLDDWLRSRIAVTRRALVQMEKSTGTVDKSATEALLNRLLDAQRRLIT